MGANDLLRRTCTVRFSCFCIIIIEFKSFPVSEVGTPGEFEYVGTCSKPCNGGKITKRRTCVPPTDNSGATCYQDCSDLQEIEEDCNTKKCFDGKKLCLILILNI